MPNSEQLGPSGRAARNMEGSGALWTVAPQTRRSALYLPFDGTRSLVSDLP